MLEQKQQTEIPKADEPQKDEETRLAEEKQAKEKTDADDKKTEVKQDSKQEDRQHVKLENEIINEQIREVQVSLQSYLTSKKEEQPDETKADVKVEQKEESKPTPAAELATNINTLTNLVENNQLSDSQMSHLLALQQQVQQSSRSSSSSPSDDDSRLREATAELIEQTLIKMNQGKPVLPKVDAKMLRGAEPELVQLAREVEDYQKGLITLGEKKVAFDSSDGKDNKIKDEIVEQEKIVAELREKLIEKKDQFPPDRLEALEQNVQNLVTRLEVQTELKELYNLQYELSLKKELGDIKSQDEIAKKQASLLEVQAKLSQHPTEAVRDLVNKTLEQANLDADASQKKIELISGQLIQSKGDKTDEIVKLVSELHSGERAELDRYLNTNIEKDNREQYLTAIREVVAEVPENKYQPKLIGEDKINANLPYQRIDPDVYVRKSQEEISKMRIEQAVFSDSPVVELHKVLSANPEAVKGLSGFVQEQLTKYSTTSVSGVPEDREKQNLTPSEKSALELQKAVDLKTSAMTELLRTGSINQEKLTAIITLDIKSHTENLHRDGASRIALIREETDNPKIKELNEALLDSRKATENAVDSSREKLKEYESLGLRVNFDSEREQKTREAGAKVAVDLATKELATQQGKIDGARLEKLSLEELEIKSVEIGGNKYDLSSFREKAKTEAGRQELAGLREAFKKEEMEGLFSIVSDRDESVVKFLTTLIENKTVETAKTIEGSDYKIEFNEVEKKSAAEIIQMRDTFAKDQWWTSERDEKVVKYLTSLAEYKKQTEKLEATMEDVNSGIVQAVTVEKLDIELSKAQQAGTQLVMSESKTQALEQYRTLLINENEQEYSKARDESATAKSIVEGLYQSIDGMGTKEEQLESLISQLEDRTGVDNSSLRQTVNQMLIKYEGENLLSYIHGDISGTQLVTETTMRLSGDRVGYLASQIGTEGEKATEALVEVRTSSAIQTQVNKRLAESNSTVQQVVHQHHEQKRLVADQVGKRRDLIVDPVSVDQAISQYDDQEKKRAAETIQLDDKQLQEKGVKPEALDIAYKVKKTIGIFDDDETKLKETLEKYAMRRGDPLKGEKDLWIIDQTKVAELEAAFKIVVPGTSAKEYLHSKMQSGIIFGSDNVDSRAVAGFFNSDAAQFIRERNLALADPSGTKGPDIKRISETYTDPRIVEISQQIQFLQKVQDPQKKEEATKKIEELRTELQTRQTAINEFHTKMGPDYDRKLQLAIAEGNSSIWTQTGYDRLCISMLAVDKFAETDIGKKMLAELLAKDGKNHSVISFIEASKQLATFADPQNKEKYNPTLVNQFNDLVTVYQSTTGKAYGTDDATCVDIFRKYTHSEMQTDKDGQTSFNTNFERLVGNKLETVISDETGFKTGIFADTVYHSLNVYSQGRPETIEQAREFHKGLTQIKDTIWVSNWDWLPSTAESMKLEATLDNFQKALDGAKGLDEKAEITDPELKRKLDEVCRLADQSLDQYRQKIRENTDNIVQTIEIAGVVVLVVCTAGAGSGAGAAVLSAQSARAASTRLILGMTRSQFIGNAVIATVRPTGNLISGAGNESTVIGACQAVAGFVAVPLAGKGIQQLGKFGDAISDLAQRPTNFLNNRFVNQETLERITKSGFLNREQGVLQIVQGADDAVKEGISRYLSTPVGKKVVAEALEHELGKEGLERVANQSLDDILFKLNPEQLNNVIRAANVGLVKEGVKDAVLFQVISSDEAIRIALEQGSAFAHVAHSTLTSGYQGFITGAPISAGITAMDPRVWEDIQTGGANVLTSALYGGVFAGGLSSVMAGGSTGLSRGYKSIFDNSRVLTATEIADMRANPQKYSATELDVRMDRFGGDLIVADKKAARDANKQISVGRFEQLFRTAMGRRTVADEVQRDLAYHDNLQSSALSQVRTLQNIHETPLGVRAANDFTLAPHQQVKFSGDNSLPITEPTVLQGFQRQLTLSRNADYGSATRMSADMPIETMNPSQLAQHMLNRVETGQPFSKQAFDLWTKGRPATEGPSIQTLADTSFTTTTGSTTTRTYNFDAPDAPLGNPRGGGYFEVNPQPTVGGNRVTVADLNPNGGSQGGGYYEYNPQGTSYSIPQVTPAGAPVRTNARVTVSDLVPAGSSAKGQLSPSATSGGPQNSLSGTTVLEAVVTTRTSTQPLPSSRSSFDTILETVNSPNRTPRSNNVNDTPEPSIVPQRSATGNTSSTNNTMNVAVGDALPAQRPGIQLNSNQQMGDVALQMGETGWQRFLNSNFFSQKRALTVEQMDAGKRILQSIEENGTFSKLDWRIYTGKVEKYISMRQVSLKNAWDIASREHHNQTLMATTDGVNVYAPDHFIGMDLPYQPLDMLGVQIRDYVSTNLAPLKRTAVTGLTALSMVTGNFAPHIQPAPIVSAKPQIVQVQSVKSGVTTPAATTQATTPTLASSDIFSPNVTAEQAVKAFSDNVRTDAAPKVSKQAPQQTQTQISDSVVNTYKYIQSLDQQQGDQEHSVIKHQDREQDVIRAQEQNLIRHQQEDHLARTAQATKNNSKKKEDEELYGEESSLEEEKRNYDKKKQISSVAKLQEEEAAIKLQEATVDIAFTKWRRSGFTMVLEPIYDKEGNVIGQEWKEKLAIWTC